MVLTVAAGAFAVGDIIEDDTPDALTVRGLVTSVAGTNPNITLQYIVLGDLTDFSAATGTFNAAAAVANAKHDQRTAPWSRRQRLIRRGHTPPDRVLEAMF